MSFLHPEFLYLMVVPLVILFGLLLTQKQSQEEFFSKEVLEKLQMGAKGLSLRARNGIFFFIGLLMIIALAQPVIEDKEIQVQAKSADVIIALDISDSMLATDVYPNRLVNAKEKMKIFLDLGKNERYAILAFARNSFLVAPLTFDKQASQFLLEKLDVNSITEKGTDFLVMLQSIEKSFTTKSKKFVVIFTDGGDNEEFSKEIAYAKKHNMVVLVLGIGTEKGAPIQGSDGLLIKDRGGNILISKRNDSINTLTSETGGIYVKSLKTEDDVQAIYEEISTMAPKALQDMTIKKHIPLFYYPLSLALFLLLIATSSLYKRESKKISSLVLLVSLLGFSTSSEALVFDFLDINKAKQAYNNAEYEKASELYLEHAKETNNPASYYNGANALYKQEKYEQAIENYKNAEFKDKKNQAKNYANIGNAHAKLEIPEELEKAKESYEKSLELEENKNIRENLEMVKKALEEMKQQEEKNEDKNEEGDDKAENNEQQNENQTEKNQNSDEQKNDTEQDNTSDKKEKSDAKEERDQDEASDKDNAKSNTQEESEENKQDTKDENSKEPDETDEENSDEANSDEANSSSQLTEAQMSDDEMRKWFEKLNKKSSTYIYKLNSENTKQERHNDRPW